MKNTLQIETRQEKSTENKLNIRDHIFSVLNTDTQSQKIEGNWRNPTLHKVNKRNGKKAVSLEYWLKNKFTFQGSDDEFVSKTQTLRACDKQILSHLIHFTAKGLPSFMSQKYIAFKTGYSRGYVNARIQHLLSLGLLDIYTRGQEGKQRSNVYQLAGQFFRKELWERMLIVPAVRSMFLMLLLVSPVMKPVPRHIEKIDFMGKCTLLKNKEKNFIISNSTDTSNVKEFGSKKRVSSMKSNTNFLNGNDQDYFARQSIPTASQKRAIQAKRDMEIQETNRICRVNKLQKELVDLERTDEEAIAKVEECKRRLKMLGLL